jgi:hypothetical protein
MNTLSKHIVLSLTIANFTSHLTQCDLWDDHFRLMNEHFARINNLMESFDFPEPDQTAAPSIEVKEDEQAHTTTITIDNVTIPALNATIKETENIVLIEDPEITIELANKRMGPSQAILVITVSQKNEVTRDIDGQKSHSYASQVFSRSMPLKTPILFSGDNTKIDYNETSKKLSIQAVHLQPSEARTQVPINLVSSTPTKSAPEAPFEK